MKISATVVTYNEVSNIERCLKSLDFCDEIIVVDSHSTDDTVKIARKYTKKIFPMDFSGFSAIKNFAVDKAENDWIFSLDADEEAPQGLRDCIKKIIQSKDSCDGYMIKREDFFLGRQIKHCGWNRDYQLRLFKRSKGRFNGRAVHESVELTGTPGKIETPIFHYSYPDSRTYFVKMNRYTSIQAKEKTRPFLLLSMIFAPVFKFFRMYFLKLGFLDGIQGFILSVYSGISEFVKFSKMAEEKRSNAAGKKILLRAPNWIGDAVMMSAFIKTVSSHYDKVYVAISNNGVKAVLQGNPYITEIIQYDKKSLFSTLGAICTIRDLKFDAGVSFTPSLSSYLLMWAAGVKLRAGYASDLGGLFLNRTYSADKSHKREHVMEEYKKLLCLVRNDFDFLGAKQLLLPEGNLAWKTRHKWKNVLIAPFASFGKSKMWPMEYYLELISGIIKKSKNIRIYVTGSAQDKMFNLGSGIENNPVFFDMRGAPLTEVMDIARNTDLFIGNDSGIMHIADSFSVPMIVIFGSTAPTWGGPVNSKAELIYKAIECQPCFEKECRFGHYNCLKNIKPDEVLSKVMKFF